MNDKKVKVGLIGLGHRGIGLLTSMLACKEADVVALCDLYDERIKHGVEIVKKERGNEPKVYSDYNDLINDENVEAVVICSYWEEHTRMACASMLAGKYTACEVAGAYDIEDCWELVRTYEKTKTPIMMLENCCFDRFELLSSSLMRAGKLGKVVYASGSYSHELRGEILGGNVCKHYRLRNYEKRNCENYPTHELGPIAKILDINRGNKMLSLSSVATRGNYGLTQATERADCPDASLKGTTFAQGDVVVTNIICAGGEVITLRLDTTLPRTYSREFTLHGTKGYCQQDTDMVMLESKLNMHEFFEADKTNKKYMGNAEEYKEYLPDVWKNITDEERELGHGGMDFIEFKVFFDAILNKKEMPIDVYDMAAWMSITPLSEQSILTGGTPQPIPDFTRGKWLLRKPLDVVDLPKVECDDDENKNILGRQHM